MPKRKKTNIQLQMSNFQSTSASNTEDNHDLDKFKFNKVDVGIWNILYYYQIIDLKLESIFCLR